MKSLLKQLTTAAVFIVTAVAQDPLRVETPISPVVCRPVLINWSGGTPPYFLSILPGGQPTAPALLDFGTIESGNSFRWVVNFAPGTSLGINLRDSTGALAQTAPFTVQDSSDTSCVGQNPSDSSSAVPPTSSGASASSSSGTVSRSSTTGASTPSPPTPSGSTSRSTGSSGTRSATGTAGGASSTPSSPAAINAIPAAFAGLAGAAVVLLA